MLGRVYGAVYGWQDRLVERVLQSRADLSKVGMLAQLGMSSQLAVFGVCIAVNHPLAYVWILLAQLVFVVGLFALTPSNQEVSLEHR